MREYPKFKNAPITEALLDIRVELPPSADLLTLDKMYDTIKDLYPNRQVREISQFQIQQNEEGSQETKHSIAHDGYFFTSETKDKVVQARLDGYSFSKLKPYKDWKTFRDEAYELWDVYKSIANPLKVTRLALRYINRIVIPQASVDFNEYFLTTPEISQKLSQSLSEFYMRLVMPQDDMKSVAILTQTLGRDIPNQNEVPIIFDVDVFQQVDLPPDSNEIGEVFEHIHNVKNQIFFDSLKPKTEELFQ